MTDKPQTGLPCIAVPRAELEEVAEALERATNKYVSLVESGDAGFWDAEEVPEVIAARAALAKLTERLS